MPRSTTGFSWPTSTRTKTAPSRQSRNSPCWVTVTDSPLPICPCLARGGGVWCWWLHINFCRNRLRRQRPRRQHSGPFSFLRLAADRDPCATEYRHVHVVEVDIGAAPAVAEEAGISDGMTPVLAVKKPEGGAPLEKVRRAVDQAAWLGTCMWMPSPLAHTRTPSLPPATFCGDFADIAVVCSR